MDFSYKELTLLNRMIGIAMMSGKIEFDDVSKSIHEKVTGEIERRTTNISCLAE